MSLLETTVQTIKPLHSATIAQAQARQNQLTKPPGSLGHLEHLSCQLAGIGGRLDPPLAKKHVVVMAGDHGVTAEGVSAYPAAVTQQMVYNFLSGGAAINVLARQIGAMVTVVDMGVAGLIATDHPRFLDQKIALGTQNMALGPAMTRQQAAQAIETGIKVVDDLAESEGLNLLMTGDMGIGNTTPSAAIAAVITGRAPADVTGRGTGINDTALQHKIAVIEQAIAMNRPDPTDPLDVLAKVGGFEIGGIAGLILGAAARRVPVIIDGFISTAGALIAVGLASQAKDYLITGHRSAELGHQAMLAYLGLTPLLDLDLRLGEGTGAALAANLVEAAVRVLNDMATFAEAGVSDKEEDD
jgi:nicotinate-nucleotide--dimethylbenzimidazole phosphoribosyltransferase